MENTRRLKRRTHGRTRHFRAPVLCVTDYHGASGDQLSFLSLSADVLLVVCRTLSVCKSPVTMFFIFIHLILSFFVPKKIK